MSALVDAVIAYKFIKLLSTPWTDFEAYSLGIIDDKGRILKKRSNLKTDAEKQAYTILHRLVWNLRRILEKVPIMQSRLSRFAAALWLLKEHVDPQVQNKRLVEELFLKHLKSRNIKIDLREDKHCLPYILPGRYSHQGRIVTIRERVLPIGTVLQVPVFKIPTSKSKFEVVSHAEIKRLEAYPE